MSENTTTDLGGRSASTQWHDRPLLALAVRLVVLLCPVSVAVLLGFLVSRSLPSQTATLAAVRGVVTAAVSLVAFVVLGRAGRRFLPLAILLRLNLVFPDRAPSRFSVALRSTSVRKLERFVHEARTTDDAVVLAEKVVTLASALNSHDRRTRGHCERTRALADLIVEELHLSPVEANQVRWGAFLHDIGKLVVPVEILNKPGKPTPSEWEVLRRHPEAGARLVEPLRAFLAAGVDAVGSHHENFDGSGYPTGRAGEDLPLAARIVSVADAFEVMTAVRAYKRPLSLQSAREELTRRSGSQFDPAVVRAFLNVSRRRVHWSLGTAAWLAELPFLAILPRTLAQLRAVTGVTGAVSPVALPGLAAASLGALSVVVPLQPSGHPSTPTTGRAVATAAAPTAAATPATAGASSTADSSTGPDRQPVPTVVPAVTVPAGPLVVPGGSSVSAALSPVSAALSPVSAALSPVSSSLPAANGGPLPVNPRLAPVSIADVLGAATPSDVSPDNPVTAVVHDVGSPLAVVDPALGLIPPGGQPPIDGHRSAGSSGSL